MTPLLLRLLAGIAQPALAQGPSPGAITGLVTGPQGEPVSSVTVLVVGTRLTALSGTDGRFLISGVPAGTYQVRARLIGYAAQTVAGGQGAGGRRPPREHPPSAHAGR